ncbi:DUF4755 domain-containing protein [Solidesulfovibrio magneticus]|uniref:DUF4755 domain-containing protein n=1 Tax=Solidesulfovibrio magneticus TaxID=184917 RepID=UPI0005BAB9C7|nr:DUF4755 domain-containing protein [Solidesulfovibrio magneticus]
MSATGFVVIFGLIVLFGILLKRLSEIKIPKTADPEKFRSHYHTLPTGFGYFHYFDRTGYAINITEKQILLILNDIPLQYPISAIREVKKLWVTPGKTIVHGKKDLSTSVSVSAHNARMARDAYDDSGLFLHLADINLPTVNIKFANPASLDRSYEIFLQAMEGVLPEDTTSGTEADSSDGSVETLRQRRKAQGLCILCGGPLSSSKEQVLGYCKVCANK